MSSKFSIRLFFTLVVFAASLALSACSTLINDPDDQTVAENLPPENVQQTPPQQPPMPEEVIPMLSDPQTQIWRRGYWAMINSQFVWVPGKIIPRPYPTAVWAGAHWVHHVYGWSFQQGHWQ